MEKRAAMQEVTPIKNTALGLNGGAMKKKLITLCAILILAATTLCGCLLGGTAGESEGLIYNADTELYIIVADESAGLYVDDLFNKLAFVLNSAPIMQSDAYEKQKHEIVVGPSQRQVSKDAYSKLAALGCTDSEIAFVIYSDGASIAIAYDEDKDELAISRAFEYLKENLLGESLILDSGYSYSEKIDTDAYYKNLYEAAVEEQWEALEEAVGGELGAEIVTAMKNLYGIYDAKVVDWFAGLYDPGVGGYYYSNSARDNYGYLPDAESTNQALNFWASSGMCREFGGSYAKAIPTWMREQIVAFVKGLQDPNGFFYHPQWGKALTDSKISRRARDLNWCVSMLTAFGEMPRYSTPSGVTVGGNTEGISYESELTDRLGKSAVTAVSRVIAAESETAYAEYLENRETFEAYLANLDIRNKSYPVGNEITASSNQIKTRDKQLREAGADYSLMQITIDWLNKNQNPETGLWNWDDDLYYGVNGLLKISGIYTAFESPIPYAEEAASSAMAAITHERDIEAVVDIYNTWFSISNILTNLRKYTPDKAEGAARADAIVQSLREKAPAGIVRSMEKILAFRKDDFSFSYTVNYSSSTSQGVPAAVPKSVEGDVNATVISMTGLTGNIYKALDLNGYKVQIFTEIERQRYVKLLEELSPVDKSNGSAITVDPLDFEEDTVGNEPDSVTFNPGDGSKGSLTVTDSGKNGKGIEFISKKGSYDSVRFENRVTAMAATAGCYVFESDFLVADEGTDDSHYFAQISMQSSYGFSFRTAGDGMLHIWETSSFSQVNARETELAVVPLDQWFNLRIEYYYGTRSSVRIKAYVNGELVAVTDNYFNSSGDKLVNLTGNAPSSYYDYAQIAITKDYNAAIKMDNVYVAKEAKSYEAESATDLVWNSDIVGADRVVHTFDDAEALDAFTVKAGGATVDADGELAIDTTVTASDATLKLPINIRDGMGDASVFGASITVPSSADGLVGRIVLAENNSKEHTIAALRLTVVSDGAGQYLTVFEEDGNGAAVSEINGVAVELGQTLELRVEYYRREGCILVFADGVLVGISTSLYSSAYTRQCGLVKLVIAGNRESSILFDDLYFERVDRTFADASAPETPSKPGMYTELESNGAGNTLYSVNTNYRAEAFNATVLSAKVNFISGAEGANQRLVFLDENGAEIFAFDFYKAGDKIQIREVTERQERDVALAELNIGKEYTLRFEIFYENGICNLTVDGIKTNATCFTYHMGADISTSYCGSAKIISRSSEGKMSHTELVLESYTMLYSAVSASGNPEHGALDFDSSTSGSIPSSVSTTLKSSGSSVAIKESEINGATASVLAFTTKPGANDTFSYKSADSVSESDGCVVVEARVKIDWVSGSSVFQLYLDGAGASSSGIAGYFCQIDYKDGRLRFLDASNNNSTETYGGNTYNRYTGPSVDMAAEGEWFDLRIEYYVKDANTVVIKTYVNDSLIYVSNCYHKSHRGTAPLAEKIIGFRAYSLGSTEATLLVDEISIYSDNRVCADDPFNHDITE